MNIEGYYLLLPIEVSRRELLAKLFLAMKAARRGYPVLLGEHSSLVFNLFSNGFYLYKDHAPWSVSKLSRIKSAGVDVGCLDEEGLIYKSEDIYKKTRCSSESLRLADVIFLWGSEQYRVIESFVTDKYVISGNPRVDLLNLVRKIQEKKSESSRKILINTRFTSCNGLRGQEELNNLKKLKVIDNEKDHIEYLKFIENDRLIFDEFVKFIKKIGKNPKFEITIRPHPNENPNFYLKLAKLFDNVVVDNDSELVSQIIENDIIVHDGCTTAIEACAANRIVLGLRPKEVNMSYGVFANKFSKNFLDSRSLCKYIEEFDRTDYLHSVDVLDAERFIENWCSNNLMSSEVIIETIDKFRQKSKNYIDKSKANRYTDLSFFEEGFRYRFRTWLFNTSMKGILSSVLGGRFRAYLKNVEALEYKFPVLTLRKIQDAILLLISIDGDLGSSDDYSIKLINDKVFELRFKV